MQTDEGEVYRLGTGQLREVCQDLGRTFNLANYGKGPLTPPGDTVGLLTSIFVSFLMVSDINYSNYLGKESLFFRSYERGVVDGSPEVR